VCLPFQRFGVALFRLVDSVFHRHLVYASIGNQDMQLNGIKIELRLSVNNGCTDQARLVFHKDTKSIHILNQVVQIVL